MATVVKPSRLCPPTQVSVLHGSEPGEHVGHAIAPPQYMQVRRPSVAQDLYAGHSPGETTRKLLKVTLVSTCVGLDPVSTYMGLDPRFSWFRLTTCVSLAVPTSADRCRCFRCLVMKFLCLLQEVAWQVQSQPSWCVSVLRSQPFGLCCSPRDQRDEPEEHGAIKTP